MGRELGRNWESRGRKNCNWDVLSEKKNLFPIKVKKNERKRHEHQDTLNEVLRKK